MTDGCSQPVFGMEYRKCGAEEERAGKNKKERIITTIMFIRQVKENHKISKQFAYFQSLLKQ